MSTVLTCPLKEGIGDPKLLVQREKEIAEYAKWMPRNISKLYICVPRSQKSAYALKIYEPFPVIFPHVRVGMQDKHAPGFKSSHHMGRYPICGARIFRSRIEGVQNAK